MSLDLDYRSHQGYVAKPNRYLTSVPSPPLSHWVESFWQLTISEGAHYYRSVPDNCVDLILNMEQPEDAFLITPFSSPNIFELRGPVSYFGIRFSILGHQGLISVPVGEWDISDGETQARDLLPPQVLNRIFDGIGEKVPFKSLCQKISDILLKAVIQPVIDPRLAKYIRYCHHNMVSAISLSEKQCSEFGVSSRQLRRLSHLYLGLSPRTFARVLRFQSTLNDINAYSGISQVNRYYDQPHLIREFKRLSGLTPSEFRTLSVLYNSN